jgi:pyruvate kinase
MLRKLHKAGMNVVRINMSHATHRSAASIILKIDKINTEINSQSQQIGILLDTQGPEIRTGDTSLPIELKVGDQVTLTVRDQVDVETSSIKVNYKDLVHSVDVGSRVSVDNGLINFKVLSKDSETLLCKVLHGGKLGSKRHVNLPGVRINLPSITHKDIQDINFGIKHDVDFIAASFVRNANDLEILGDILKKKKSSAKIIAKIENQEGLDNIDEICQSAWGVMVARGDLGIETSLTDLPNIQRNIMFACAKWGKRSIVATHLLESMINNPTPTRAEVTDIANAIYEGADAVMLSGETSVGKHPVRVIQKMSEIIMSVENSPLIKVPHQAPHIRTDRFITKSLCHHAALMSKDTNSAAICTLTNSGYTAFQISAWRPQSHILAFTTQKRILGKLNLLWGVRAFFYDENLSTDDTVLDINRIAKEKDYVTSGDIVINLTSMPVEERGMVNTLRVSEID